MPIFKKNNNKTDYLLKIDFNLIYNILVIRNTKKVPNLLRRSHKYDKWWINASWKRLIRRYPSLDMAYEGQTTPLGSVISQNNFDNFETEASEPFNSEILHFPDHNVILIILIIRTPQLIGRLFFAPKDPKYETTIMAAAPDDEVLPETTPNMTSKIL